MSDDMPVAVQDQQFCAGNTAGQKLGFRQRDDLLIAHMDDQGRHRHLIQNLRHINLGARKQKVRANIRCYRFVQQIQTV